MDTHDPWRPLNVFIHGPRAIGQIVKGKWYNYYSDGQNPANCCDSGEYDYFYDALGNVNGVLDSGGHYYRWEMDAFGNDLPSGNSFLDMDQPGAKEHLTGKLFDTATGLYYFAARWYDPQVGRFVSKDPSRAPVIQGWSPYTLTDQDPVNYVDPDGEKFINPFKLWKCYKAIKIAVEGWKKTNLTPAHIQAMEGRLRTLEERCDTDINKQIFGTKGQLLPGNMPGKVLGGFYSQYCCIARQTRSCVDFITELYGLHTRKMEVARKVTKSMNVVKACAGIPQVKVLGKADKLLDAYDMIYKDFNTHKIAKCFIATDVED